MPRPIESVDLTSDPRIGSIRDAITNQGVLIVAEKEILGTNLLERPLCILVYVAAFSDPILTFRSEDVAGTVEEMRRRMLDLSNGISYSPSGITVPELRDRGFSYPYLIAGALIFDLGIDPGGSDEDPFQIDVRREMHTIVYPNVRVAQMRAPALLRFGNASSVMSIEELFDRFL